MAWHTTTFPASETSKPTSTISSVFSQASPVLLGVDGLRGCEERLARHRAGSGLVDSLDRRFEVRTEAGIGELVLGVLPRSLVGALQLELLLGQVVVALHHRFLPCSCLDGTGAQGLRPVHPARHCRVDPERGAGPGDRAPPGYPGFARASAIPDDRLSPVTDDRAGEDGTDA